MFDYRVLILLLLGFVTMYLVSYNCRIVLTPQVLYGLLPVALGLIILVGCTSLRTPPRLRLVFIAGTIVLIAVSIYIFITSRSQIYSHVVYTTSIKVIWVVIIAGTILYWKDPQKALKMGILRTVLLVGLFVSIYLIPPIEATLLPQQVQDILKIRSDTIA